jgi:DNA primase
LKREARRKAAPAPSGKKASAPTAMNLLELNLIRLMLEYPQRALLVEQENILDCFLENVLKDLGTKILETYKLLGYVDINVLLPSDEDKPLRERLYKMSVEEPPAEDDQVERNFADNMRRIREKWYKEQKRQVQHKLRQAQEGGNQDLIRELTFQKQNLMKEENKYVNKS